MLCKRRVRGEKGSSVHAARRGAVPRGAAGGDILLLLPGGAPSGLGRWLWLGLEQAIGRLSAGRNGISSSRNTSDYNFKYSSTTQT